MCDGKNGSNPGGRSPAAVMVPFDRGDTALVKELSACTALNLKMS